MRILRLFVPLLFAGLVFAPARVFPQSTGYVGSEMCLSCHPQFESWRGTMHATGLKSVANDAFSLQPGNGVVADFDGNGVDDFKQGLDLNVVSSEFAQFQPNAPILGYSPETGYTIRIGSVTFPVRFAYGGSGAKRQLYAVKIPVVDREDRRSAAHYISPVQYDELTHRFVPYNAQSWYAPDGSPRVTPSTTTKELPESVSFEKNCAGCHFNSVQVGADGNEWVATAPPAAQYFAGDPHYIDMNGDGSKEQVNVGCERCHGPGLEHVVGGGARDKIINPSRDFTARQENELCGSCHSAGESRPDGVFAYPFDEETQQPYAANLGASLFESFFRSLPLLWPAEDESRQYHQQLQDYENSAKADTAIRCSSCHAVHLNVPGQIRPVLQVPDSTGNPILIPAAVADNTQCLACHAGRGSFAPLKPEDLLDLEGNQELIADTVTGHTFHPYKPEEPLGLSRCTECHMARVSWNAIPYDTAAHTFRVIPPDATLSTQEQGGMPSSCAVRCHRQWAPVFGQPVDLDVTDWTEESDIQVAEWLRQFYGPTGLWWQTEPQQRSAAGSSVVRRRSKRGGAR